MGTAEHSRRQIEELLFTYAERIDAGDFVGVGALFADGEIRAAEHGPSIRGAEAVRRLYAATVRVYEDGTPRTKHVTSNVIVDVDESADTATVLAAAGGILIITAIVIIVLVVASE